jgi:tRNA uridine 5-carbamoylmethylation protein Kti12
MLLGTTIMLIIIRGLPGSGKSTFANRYWRHVVEADDFFMSDNQYHFNTAFLNQAHAYCADKAILLLSKGLHVCVANTFVTANQILRYKLLADAVKTEFKVYKMEYNFQSIHNVPGEVINRMKSAWQAWPGEIMVNEDREGQNTTDQNQGFDH